MSIKEPKSVKEILNRIDELKSEIKERQADIEALEGRLRVHDQKPEPVGFDYGSAILAVFSKNPSLDLNLDAIDKGISEATGYSPNRNKIANKVAYIVDRDKKLVRVEGKRGFYRLATKNEPPKPVSGTTDRVVGQI